VAKSKQIDEKDERIAELEADKRRLQGLLSRSTADPRAITVRLPYDPLPEGAKRPTRRTMNITVSGDRASKLFACLDGMQRAGVHVTLGRGVHENDVLVSKLSHVLYRLIDQAELTGVVPQPVDAAPPEPQTANGGDVEV